MPLPFEKFQALRQQGLSNDQIRKFESGYIPGGPPKQDQAKQGFGDKVKSFGKGVFNFFTGSEQTLGQGLSTVGVNWKTGDVGASGVSNIQGNQESQMQQSNQKIIDAIHNSKDPAKIQQLTQFLQRQQSGNADPRFHDTSQISGNAPTAGDINPAFNLSNEQVIGAAGGVALDVLSAGTYGKAAKGMQSGKLAMKAPSIISNVGEKAATQPGIVKGIIGGAKAGAKAGAVVGGAYGITQGMQENKSTGGVIISGIEGGITGGITGGVLGGIGGGIQGYKSQAEANALQKQQTALSSIVPQPKELTPTEYEKMVKQGRVTPKTKMGAASIIPSKQERQLATKYEHLLQSKDPVKNAGNVINAISQSDSEVGQFLQSHNGAYSNGQLKNSLMNSLKDVNDITIDEGRLNKAKQQFVDNFVGSLKKNDLVSLWQNKKQALGSKAFEGSPTLKKDISIGIRKGIQDFVTSQLKDPTYANKMKDMTELFNVLDAVDSKATTEKGQSAIGMWMKNNPGKTKGIEWAIGLAGLEGGYKIYKHFVP